MLFNKYFGKIEVTILMEITRHSRESTFSIYTRSKPYKNSVAGVVVKCMRRVGYGRSLVSKTHKKTSKFKISWPFMAI